MDTKPMVESTNIPLPPTAIVIFGGTGDLAQTKLFSALFHLYLRGALPDRLMILGVSRKEISEANYQEYVGDCLRKQLSNPDQTSLAKFCEHLTYLQGDFGERETYLRLATRLKAFDQAVGQCTSKLFYLAVPPQLYGDIFKHVDEAELLHLCDGVSAWSRLLVEKPFGRDLETAEALEADLCARFTEDQIHRIDHYLAKDAVENIIALRFANSILADSWHGEHIESIKIRLLEKKDVSQRGSFYDGVGALRDVGQNHMLQILALLTMSPDSITDVTAIRAARAHVLAHLLPPSRVVKGQYEGFRNTVGVEKDSVTETYFFIETTIATERFARVPIILEAGKALHESVNDVTVTFRPRVRWDNQTEPHVKDLRNILRIQFASNHTITLTVWMKKTGFTTALEERELVLAQSSAEDVYSPEAYERVLYDCIVGDQTRFVSGDEVMAAWRFITPLLAAENVPLHTYAPGTVGPLASGPRGT